MIAARKKKSKPTKFAVPDEYLPPELRRMPPGQEHVQEQLRMDRIAAKKSIRLSKILITRQSMMEKSNQIKE